MQLSRSKGWGDDGIKITPLGAAAAQVAALKTHQVDGVTTDSVTVYNLVEQGSGRILVKFGDSVKDFHVHVIYASDKLIASNPDGLKAFLAGWMETIRFMRDNKAKAIAIAAQKTGVSKAVATEGYNDTMPIFSTTGHFEPKALDVLATSFVDTKLLPDEARHVEAAHGSVSAEMTTGDAAIQVRDVSHQFGEPGDAQFVQALQHTSLDIARGELLCLIGPSGCGKSTLLNMIGGLLTPTTGTVEVHGKPVRGPLPHDIAFVFQENALFPWCTIIENVKLGMVFQGVPKAEQEPRARKALEAVGLEGLHGPLSGAAFRRHAPARGARARAQPGDRHPADGRAVRRARRADPHDPRRGPFGAAVQHRQDHRVRHPFARRSGVPGRPRRGVLGAARPHQGDHRGRRAASAQARPS